MAWVPPAGWTPATSEDALRVRAMQRQAVQAQLALNEQNGPNAHSANGIQGVPLPQPLNPWVGNQQAGVGAGGNTAIQQQLKLLLQQQQAQQGVGLQQGAGNSLLANLGLQQQQQQQQGGLQQFSQGNAQPQPFQLGAQGLSTSPTPVNAGHLAGGVASTNQAVLLALMQQIQRAGHPSGQVTGLAPGQGLAGLVNPIQSNPLAAVAAANMRAANARASAGLANYLPPGLQRRHGAEVPGFNTHAQQYQHQLGLLQQQQQQQQQQRALLDLQLHQLQQQAGQHLGLNAVSGVGQALQYHPQMQMGVTQRVPITSTLGTGLANTPMGSAPLLPIFGTDLAKPSETKSSSTMAPNASTSSLTSVSVGSPNKSVTSQESTSMKSTSEVSLPSTSPGLPVSGVSATVTPAEAIATGGAAAAPTAAATATATAEPKQKPAESVPMGMAAIDLSSLSSLAAQSEMNTLLNRQSDDLRLLAAQLGINTPPTGGNLPPTQGGVPVLGVPVPQDSSGLPKERDMGTLKTLGQMLARTNNSVENAVQGGLLGGCNAEDVKNVWDAFVAEKTVLKQQLSAAVPQAVGSDGGLGGVKISEEALKSLLATSGHVPISAPTSQLSDISAAVAAAKEAPAQAMEKKEEDIIWDGIIENEEDYVPSQVISAVNEAEAPKANAFDAFSYGFFAAAGEADGELLEELGDELESEDTNEEAIAGLMSGAGEEESVKAGGTVGAIKKEADEKEGEVESRPVSKSNDADEANKPAEEQEVIAAAPAAPATTMNESDKTSTAAPSSDVGPIEG